MTGPVRLAALGCACVALLAGCGSSTTSSTSSASRSANASATASATTAPTPTTAPGTPVGALTVNRLRAVYAKLDPTGTSGHNCVTGSTTPSYAACPLTPRLVAALNASLAAQSGPGADPLCGCQAFDPKQQLMFSVGQPAGGGTIRVTSFGAPSVDYVVLVTGNAFLVDDIIYCSPSPHSIYPGEKASSC
jgi:hypothetical protein